MGRPECLEDRVSGWKFAHNTVIGFSDSSEEEVFQRGIVAVPDTVSSGVSGEARLREGSVEIFSEPLLACE
jgi:hypothetical protein